MSNEFEDIIKKAAQKVYEKFNHGVVFNSIYGLNINKKRKRLTFFVDKCDGPDPLFTTSMGHYEIITNLNGEITSFKYSYFSPRSDLTNNVYHDINLFYNKKFKLFKIEIVVGSDHFFGSPIKTIKISPYLMNDKEEFLLINCFLNKHTLKNSNILPEFFIHGVYDFKSSEFLNRLSLFEMMID